VRLNQVGQVGRVPGWLLRLQLRTPGVLPVLGDVDVDRPARVLVAYVARGNKDIFISQRAAGVPGHRRLQ
jgi:hypothetical protein